MALPPLAGVACHQGGTWYVVALAEPVKEEDMDTTHVLSDSAMPDAIRSGMMAGAPLDAAGEKKAHVADWNAR